MGIRVRHDPGIQTPGQMAAAIGLGQKRRVDQQRADQIAMFNAQMQMQYDRMRLSENARKEAMGHDRDMLGMRLDASEKAGQTGFQRQMAMAQAGYDADMSKMDHSQSQYMDRMAFQDELTKGRIQFEYTEQQKREMEKYAQGLAWIQEQGATGAWSPAQVEDAYNQLNAKMIGIQPVPKYDDTPTGRDQFDAQAFYHDEIGEWIIPDRSGGFKVLESKKEAKQQLDPASFTKMYQAYEKSMTRTGLDADGNSYDIPPDPDEVMAALTRALTAYDRFNNPPQGGQPQGNPPMPEEEVPQRPGQQLTQTGPNAYAIHEAGTQPKGTPQPQPQGQPQAASIAGTLDQIRQQYPNLSADEHIRMAMEIDGVDPKAPASGVQGDMTAQAQPIGGTEPPRPTQTTSNSPKAIQNQAEWEAKSSQIAFDGLEWLESQIEEPTEKTDELLTKKEFNQRDYEEKVLNKRNTFIQKLLSDYEKDIQKVDFTDIPAVQKLADSYKKKLADYDKTQARWGALLTPRTAGVNPPRNK